ncbi:hypothetical protein P9112_006033 [Eukaryota sp. TZLM1-RC]
MDDVNLKFILEDRLDAFINLPTVPSILKTVHLLSTTDNIPKYVLRKATNAVIQHLSYTTDPKTFSLLWKLRSISAIHDVDPTFISSIGSAIGTLHKVHSSPLLHSLLSSLTHFLSHYTPCQCPLLFVTPIYHSLHLLSRHAPPHSALWPSLCQLSSSLLVFTSTYIDISETRSIGTLIQGVLKILYSLLTSFDFGARKSSLMAMKQCSEHSKLVPFIIDCFQINDVSRLINDPHPPIRHVAVLLFYNLISELPFLIKQEVNFLENFILTVSKRMFMEAKSSIRYDVIKCVSELPLSSISPYTVDVLLSPVVTAELTPPLPDTFANVMSTSSGQNQSKKRSKTENLVLVKVDDELISRPFAQLFPSLQNLNINSISGLIFEGLHSVDPSVRVMSVDMLYSLSLQLPLLLNTALILLVQLFIDFYTKVRVRAILCTVKLVEALFERSKISPEVTSHLMESGLISLNDKDQKIRNYAVLLVFYLYKYVKSTRLVVFPKLLNLINSKHSGKRKAASMVAILIGLDCSDWMSDFEVSVCKNDKKLYAEVLELLEFGSMVSSGAEISNNKRIVLEDILEFSKQLNFKITIHPNCLKEETENNNAILSCNIPLEFLKRNFEIFEKKGPMSMLDHNQLNKNLEIFKNGLASFPKNEIMTSVTSLLDLSVKISSHFKIVDSYSDQEFKQSLCRPAAIMLSKLYKIYQNLLINDLLFNESQSDDVIQSILIWMLVMIVICVYCRFPLNTTFKNLFKNLVTSDMSSSIDALLSLGNSLIPINEHDLDIFAFLKDILLPPLPLNSIFQCAIKPELELIHLFVPDDSIRLFTAVVGVNVDCGFQIGQKVAQNNTDHAGILQKSAIIPYKMIGCAQQKGSTEVTFVDIEIFNEYHYLINESDSFPRIGTLKFKFPSMSKSSKPVSFAISFGFVPKEVSKEFFKYFYFKLSNVVNVELHPVEIGKIRSTKEEEKKAMLSTVPR